MGLPVEAVFVNVGFAGAGPVHGTENIRGIAAAEFPERNHGGRELHPYAGIGGWTRRRGNEEV